eukprot:TRINITY_DN24271_c0_g1_i2.p1 TRINITY_DN24271_c0_g1~~TRINITY_DN24271_c0_g1_i2.p1  ORF type:complete len:363 (+),score=107.00 TRINITY_DN24271_c0_g1_i2:101-1189(+)
MPQHRDPGAPRQLPGGKQEYVISGKRFVVDERYKVTRMIGGGAYGAVCSAVDTQTGEQVAIKKIPRVFDDLVDGKRILREVKLLAFLDHDNIIHLKDLFRPTDRETFSDVYFVSELMDTDLHQVIRSNQPLTGEHVQYFVYQALRGLKYIHSADILHRDLKPGNLLVNGECDLLICDFGLARGYDQQDLTDYVVTRWYRPPELLLLATDYTAAVDIWSIGCIFVEMITRQTLFPGKDYINQLNHITDLLGIPTDAELQRIRSPEAVRFLRSMKDKRPKTLDSVVPQADPLALAFAESLLRFDPGRRLSATAALEHPYFADIHDPGAEPECPRQYYWDLDAACLTADQLRSGLWEEITRFHPD